MAYKTIKDIVSSESHEKAQEVMLDDRRDYDISTNGQNEQRKDGEYSMTESEIVAAEEIKAKKGTVNNGSKIS